MSKPYLQHYFDNPYIEGFCRWIENGVCYYIPKKEMERALLEDLQSVKFTKVIGCE